MAPAAGHGGRHSLAAYNDVMRLIRTLSAVALLSAGLFAAAGAQTVPNASGDGGRVVLVLPFENHSGNPTLSWIGDSFPDTLDRRLGSAGFLTISRDDRVFAYDHLGLPEGFRPSRATAVQIARQLDANYVIVGSFSVVGNTLTAQARVLSVDALRLSQPVQDGADLQHLLDAENAIAWKLARTIQPGFSVAESTFVGAPGAVPLPAFEDYIRGDNASVPAERLQRLKAAVAYAPDYPAALLALGKEQYAERDFTAAAATLTKVPPASPLALEGGFYLGLSRFNSANYAGAETAFAFVATHLPLPEVLNNEAVAQSRQGKNAVALLQRASSADPSDEDYHYNLAVSLFRQGETAPAQAEVQAALKLKPNDYEAHQLDSLLRAAAPGTHLATGTSGGFSPLERIRRTYSETSYRQAAFQLDQLRTARLATMPPAQQASEYATLGREALSQGLLPEAEARFRAALSADPGSAEAQAGVAEVSERSGNAAQARLDALASLRLQPNPFALLVLARLDLAKSALTVSADEVSQALALDPRNGEALALRQTLVSRGQPVR